MPQTAPCSNGRYVDGALATLAIAHKLEMNGLAARQARDNRPVAAAHPQRRFRKVSHKKDMDQVPIGLE